MNYNNNNIILPQLMTTQEHQVKKKPHVHIACSNCKKAHLACDESRPCKRCIATDKADTCQNTEHKKRGRPKLIRDESKSKSRRLNAMIPELVNSVFSTDNSMKDEDTLQMMTMFITLDLCCARASDESFEFLDLYPQELAHRSIYDFILPGEESHVSKIHRYLLNNIAQQHQQKIPNNILRSSSDLFYSTPARKLLDIANGSQTFKQTIKFRRKEKQGQEMQASFYLGGGLGADLLESSTFSQLYIVCILSPTVPIKRSGAINLSSLLLLNHDIRQVEYQQQRDEEERLLDILSSSPSNSYSSPTNSYNSLTSPSIEQQHELSMFQIKSSTKDNHSLANNNNKQPPQQQPQQQQQQQPFAHPNELYYFQTTSSRLSSEAMARTAYPYLSGTNLVNTNIHFSPLAKFNSMSTTFLS
ncbi:hypothetical protein BCV71DRAFT_172971 [Rhizopus microsporus]|uniref:Zn(2)-C6 fungal-type domain-containing protein n=1 Tax=Rhizopus microsporus TaxID=58291 RepID=A0A1X0SC57_RHIZD|nr:hypothetical protein BCV71DRAFT_172971 [Rhizopus microsporus]